PSASVSPVSLASVFKSSVRPRDLHSFPTRRSSDLTRFAPEPDHGVRVVMGLVQDRFPPGLTACRCGEHTLHGGARTSHIAVVRQDRKSTRLNSSHVKISYAVFCLKKKKDTAESIRP